MRLLLLALLAAGCSTASPSEGDAQEADPPETVEEYQEQRAALVDRLDAAIGEAKASDVGACRVVAVGAKACGGPAEYRVYSTSDADADTVEALGDEIARLDAYANEQFGLVSTCEMVNPPRPNVLNGRCVGAVAEAP